MPTFIEGNHVAPEEARFGVVVSRFNETITERMLDGALDTLRRCGADMDSVTVVRCPGAYEAPLVAKKLAQSGDVDAVIALGAVIRGATYHFELVANGAGGGVMQAALDTGVPVIFGVITTETIEQALERAGTKAGNKGADAARAAVEMVNLLAQL